MTDQASQNGATRSKTAAAWKTYLIGSGWISVAFFTVYPFCNWLTSRRDPAVLWHLYSQAELRIPLVPQFIWAYFSMYLLFLVPPFFLDARTLRRLGKRLIVATLLSGAIFLLMPARLGFVRVLPDAPPYTAIFARVFTLDLPFNTMPSLHVVYSAMIADALARHRRWLRLPALLWLALICVSTVLVHQHQIIDVVTGLLLVFLFTHRDGWRDA